MNQHEVMLAAIGDLEVTRRALIMEIQARDARIAELEAQLAESQNGGTQLAIPDKEIVLP